MSDEKKDQPASFARRDARVPLSGLAPAPGHEDAGAPQPIDPRTGQHGDYWVLSDDERAKGFLEPVRTSYKHEKCESVTRMGRAIAETYARNPSFYGSTFCCACGSHFPVGQSGEFTWLDAPDQRVGTLRCDLICDHGDRCHAGIGHEDGRCTHRCGRGCVGGHTLETYERRLAQRACELAAQDRVALLGPDGAPQAVVVRCTSCDQEQLLLSPHHSEAQATALAHVLTRQPSTCCHGRVEARLVGYRSAPSAN